MDAQKLAKVLAMAASDNEIEAVHALRTARRLLDASGVDFVEVARRVACAQVPDSGSAQVRIEDLEDSLFDLRNELRHVRAENERLRKGPAPTVPPSLAEAARDAADSIRLRAELANLRDLHEEQGAEILRLKAQGVGLTEQITLARAEAARLAGRVQELDGQRARLEAENRRLATTNRAPSLNLDESSAVPHAAPPRPKAKPRAKSPKKPANQYALL